KVRSDFVRFLILGGDAEVSVHAEGVKLESVDLIGDLNLRGCKDLHLFSFRVCRVEGVVRLDFAETRSIWLDGTKVQKLEAVRVRIDGSLYLRRGFEAEDGVDLSGCRIEGTLSCRGALFDLRELSRRNGKACLRIEDGVINGSFIFGPKYLDKNDEKIALGGDVVLRGTHCNVFADSQSTYSEMLENSWKLSLNGFSYQRLGSNSPADRGFRIAWLDLQPSEDLKEEFKPQPFEQLAMV